MPQNADANLLTGYETSDDAAVYRINDETALVHTADFITPPVDDPYLFGQIGAANSIGDIYAMGGRPVTCLNLIGFPSDDLGPEILHGIVEGAISKISEAGAVLGGGHTTDDEEPVFGLSVVGVVHPDKFWRNSGARPGDVVLLTKSIGSGVLFNGNLRGLVSVAALDSCIRTTAALNKTTAEVLERFEVHAATDVTGFGLAGHALEMARGSSVSLEISTCDVPLMAEALSMYEKGMTTGVNVENRAMIEDYTSFHSTLSMQIQELCVDPQTSGGLLVSVPEPQAKDLLDAWHSEGVSEARIIGTVGNLVEQNYLSFL